MISKRLIVVGAGKLGSFHLQGLAKITDKMTIDVYDPYPVSLKKAKVLCDQAIGAKRHSISYIENAKNLRDNYDFGINATTSGQRADSIIETGHLAENWILEKILTQSLEQMDQIESHFQKGQKVWVNHTLRELDWLKKAKKEIYQDSVVNFETIGKDWSLACNLTHYLDLLNWLSGRKLLTVDTSQLEKNWIKSKRDGHYEIFGTATAFYEGGVSATFTSRPKGSERIGILKTSDDTWYIDEASATICSKSGHRFSGQFTRQSTLTTSFATDVLSGKNLNLPSLVCATHTHRIFISAMLDHWNKTKKKQDAKVPIT